MMENNKPLRKQSKQAFAMIAVAFGILLFGHIFLFFLNKWIRLFLVIALAFGAITLTAKKSDAPDEPTS